MLLAAFCLILWIHRIQGEAAEELKTTETRAQTAETEMMAAKIDLANLMVHCKALEAQVEILKEELKKSKEGK